MRKLTIIAISATIVLAAVAVTFTPQRPPVRYPDGSGIGP